MRHPLLLLLLFLAACHKPAPPPVAGTSWALATERKALLTDLTYHLSFRIPETKADSIPASVVIDFTLATVPEQLVLDFQSDAARIKSIACNEQAQGLNIQNEHIMIEGGDMKPGVNHVRIELMAGDQALNRHEDFMYTLFVPSRASTCFPLFDQPDLKARYALTLEMPASWEAVTNGPRADEQTTGSRKTIHFATSDLLSSYQFAFAAGKFRKATDPTGKMTAYYRETDSIKVKRNLPTVFELHRKSISWLENYTGIPYSYQKFDFALMPAFQFGGMEHPGAIFYRESSLFLDEGAGVNDALRQASLIAHETAHMWFGNLVTMKWFNDVWMKEVFANFMAAKMVNPEFPAVNHELRFLLAHYPAALDIDRSKGRHPIQQPLDNLKDAGSIYGAIIYQKAPIVMRNLESLMGEEPFRAGLQEYLKKFAHSNATWDDLVEVMMHHTRKDLTQWNKAWIKSAGMPEVRYDFGADAGLLMFANSNDSAHIGWPQSFQVGMMTGRTLTLADIATGDGRTDISVTGKPEHFLTNYGGRGYGFFPADSADLAFMVGTLRTINDPLVKAGIWMNLWEHTVRGRYAPMQMLEDLMRALPREKDPLLAEYMHDKVRTIFWQFITAAQRNLMVDRLEKALWITLVSNDDPSLKRAAFQSYRSTALTRDGIQMLIRLWRNELSIGLELSERDHIQLCYEIALRQAPGAEAILKQQLEKIQNPDRRAEVSFILPALSPDSAVRNTFFRSLASRENRIHEPWVLQSVRLLRHPLWGKESEAYLRPGLELLTEVKTTGDIFFPKGWLDALLGESQSPSAVHTVESYLHDHPELPPDLRNKLLQSADMLYRASTLTAEPDR